MHCRKLTAAIKQSAAKKRAWHNGARSCLPSRPPAHHKRHHKKHHRHSGDLKPSVTHHHGHHRTQHHVSGGAELPSAKALRGHTPSDAAGTSTPATPSTIWNAGLNTNPFTAQQLERFSTLSANLAQPPHFLIPIYKAAGRRFHIPWQILAAINAIETNYGQNLAVSPAGAIGWMQFMPGTWSDFGMAAAGDHRPNPYDPRDAIFSAARYLDVSGGAQRLRQALFAYNHAWWYVDAVLWRAQLITDRVLGSRASRDGYALPLDLRYMQALGRTDDGVDIEDAPDGAAVYSITPGVVTAVASDPNGFGPDYPVVLATKGPLAGQYIYYGHVAASLVHVGQRVLPGQPIAVMGNTGDAASLGHGHIEIGFSDASGDPLNHHGAGAWTPSGDAMRHVLAALTKAFMARSDERTAHHGSDEAARARRELASALAHLFGSARRDFYAAIRTRA
jgi:peptidase M23-like protein/transglycosylase-like protein with SLT domain